MRIPSNVPGMAPVSRADTAAREPLRISLEQPRLGRDLSRLVAHGPEVTPLQYAATKVAELIAPPHQAIDGEGPAGPVNVDSLEAYVRASLGMAHDATKIDLGLAPYLEELSKNEVADRAEPVTGSSFTLLCLLHVADQVPGSAQYGQFNQEAFMGWLERQLPTDAFRRDCIPGRYFDAVQVSRNPEAGFTVQYGRDGAKSVDVQAMHGADLEGAPLQGANPPDANLPGANLRGANLDYAPLPSANLQSANLEGANLDREVLDLMTIRSR